MFCYLQQGRDGIERAMAARPNTIRDQKRGTDMEKQPHTASNNGPLAPGSTRNIGFVLSTEQFAPPDLLRFGVAAEQADFDMVWSSDHFQPWQDNQGHAGHAWVLLAALGQRTQRVPFGTGVTCPSFRYPPPIVAQAFATLGVLYPGRVFLGVGTGEALNEQAATGEWGDYDERHDRLAEALPLIRQLWSGDIVNHRGRYYTVEQARLYTLPEQPVPIFVAAAGEHSMRLAGELGDGLITDPQTLLHKPELIAAYREAARQAGKDPARMAIVVEQWMFVGEQAEVGQWANLWRYSPKSWEKYVNNPDPRVIQRQAAQEVPLDEVYKDWSVSTNPTIHVESLQKLLDAGATHILVHSPQPDQERAIQFYGREVLPRLAGRAPQPYRVPPTDHSVPPS
jgi:TAT-translocated FGD2 family F420-dependent dehydrogenase